MGSIGVILIKLSEQFWNGVQCPQNMLNWKLLWVGWVMILSVNSYILVSWGNVYNADYEHPIKLVVNITKTPSHQTIKFDAYQVFPCGNL